MDITFTCTTRPNGVLKARRLLEADGKTAEEIKAEMDVQFPPFKTTITVENIPEDAINQILSKPIAILTQGNKLRPMISDGNSWNGQVLNSSYTFEYNEIARAPKDPLEKAMRNVGKMTDEQKLALFEELQKQMK